MASEFDETCDTDLESGDANHTGESGGEREVGIVSTLFHSPLKEDGDVGRVSTLFHSPLWLFERGWRCEES